MSRLPQADGTLQWVSLERQAESADDGGSLPLAGPINKLQMAALQLMLQHLNAKSKLRAVRCSCWLLFEASDSSSWLSTSSIHDRRARMHSSG